MPQKRPAHQATKHIALIVFEGVELLEVATPASVFTKANTLRPGSYKISILSDRTGLVNTNSGLSIHSQGQWNSMPIESIDTLIMCGGCLDTVYPELVRDDLVEWIAKASTQVRRMGAICTGVFTLAQANLLHGKRCTTHWNFCDRLESAYPQTNVVHDQVFVKDGNIWSSAGILTGVDLALALVEDDLGYECAIDIARTLVAPGMRPGSSPQVSPLLNSQAHPKHPMRDLLPWIEQHLSADLSLEKLAQRATMSVRNFNRTFTREIGITPHKYVLKVRLEYAAMLLLETDWSIDEVARRSGFTSTDVLQRGFKMRWNLSPGEHRQKGTPLNDANP